MQKSDYLAIRRSPFARPNHVWAAGVLVFNVALWVGAIALYCHRTTWSYWMSQVLFALHFNHCYLIVHETSHYSFVRHRKLNVWLGHAASIFCFVPFHARRSEHAGHHRWVGTFKEPSTERALSTFASRGPWAMRILGSCWRFWIPVFAINEHFQLWRMSFAKRSPSGRRSRKLLASAGFSLTIYAGAMMLPHALEVAMTMLPALLMFFMLIEYLNLAHHVDSAIHVREAPFPLWQQHLHSKSFKPLPWRIGRVLFLDFNYHVVHHYYPDLPWHELRAVHDKLADLDPCAAFGDLEDELHWNLRTRRQRFELVFGKYLQPLGQSVGG